MEPAFRRLILYKYNVQYFQCLACGFVQTEEPYWLPEAYQSAIATADTGIMQRNIYLANAASLVFLQQFHGSGIYLDTAGGYGIFTRLMRDIGYDYYWDDPYSQNLVARGFEGSSVRGPFSAITAFEVLEHLVNPVEFLVDKIAKTGAQTVLVSTETFIGKYPDPDKWWYYAFETGQHISFFRRSTLEIIGRRLGLSFYSNGNMHMWTNKKASALQFKFLTTHKIAASLAWLPKMRLTSKVWPDHRARLKL